MIIKCCKGCERRHGYRGDLNNVMKKEAFRKKNFKRSKGPANI